MKNQDFPKAEDHPNFKPASTKKKKGIQEHSQEVPKEKYFQENLKNRYQYL